VIPQTDPKASYLAQQTEIEAAIGRVLASGWYILGKEVAAFEQEFADYIGVAAAIGVANGTDALELALRSLDIGPGDAVATVSHTAVATVAAIELVGATPILLDIDPHTYTLDPAHLVQAIREFPNLRAVIPVHLYGHPAAMPEIMALAQQHKLAVVEDCSQSHGAQLGDCTTGTWGDFAAFSLYPTKNLGAIGDGGALVSNNRSLADRAKRLREYGWEDRYISSEAGLNSRLDELQAAVLRVKLRNLEQDNNRRRAIAQQYTNALGRLTKLQSPVTTPSVNHVYHQYVIQCDQRDQLRTFLKDQGISTGLHYPAPVHKQPAYQHQPVTSLGLPVTEAIRPRILSLPMYPQLTDPQVKHIIHALQEWDQGA
jgi:dTDP-4-amino-4,6-dideoxygalactose transaminase